VWRTAVAGDRYADRARAARAWAGPALPALVLAATAAVLYLPVLADLAAQWAADENYSHGFLVPLVAGYLVWERRAPLRRCAVRVCPWGYGVLLAGIILLVLGQAATFGYAARLSLLVVLAGLVLFLAGPQVLRVAAFPLAYLLFMIPPPAVLVNRIAFPLQLLAARLATGSLDLLGVPALREGNIITLAPMRLEVTEACSGIRSLVALLALGVIVAYAGHTWWLPRVAVALSAVPIALVTNAARIALTGVLVETVGPRAGVGFYHAFSGLAVFVLAFVLLAAESLAIARATPRAGEAGRA
jgi:exosortase